MRCGNCPTTFCQYRRTDGECVFNSLPNSPLDSGYEPSGIQDPIRAAAQDLAEAVDGYIAPKKGDKYVFRGEVLEKCNKVKKLLGK